MTDHAHFEMLLMKRVDAVITVDEERDLAVHMQQCDSCAAELADFTEIKMLTDAMTQRIMAHAKLEPPRETGVVRAWLWGTWLLLFVGTLMLAVFGVHILWTNPGLPPVVRWGGALLVFGSVSSFGYVLWLRFRGRDPYEEIDR